MAGEVLDGAPVVVEQEVGHVPAEVVTHQDALNREVLTVGRERVGRHLPARDTQPVRQVEQREAVVNIFAQLPG